MARVGSSATGAVGMRRVAEIVFPASHPGVEHVMSTALRDNTLSAGRRWNKSTLCVKVASLGLLDGKRGEFMWGAPTYDQVMIGFEEMRRVFGGAAKYKTRPHPEITVPSGGRIRFRSLDNPDSARGFTADGWVLDEAADIEERAYYDVVRPMVMEGGWVWKIGTPKGRNWFWREYTRGLEASAESLGCRSWQIPTVGCRITSTGLERVPHPHENPRIPWSEVLGMYDRMPERTFRQEIMAEFITSGGYVFRDVDEVSVLAPAKYIAGHQYVMGVDWGRVTDFSVMTVIDVTDRRQVHMSRSNRVDYQVQLDRMQDLAREYHCHLVLAESNAMGEPLISECHRRGLPVFGFRTTNTSKMRIIDRLAMTLEKHQLMLLENDQQMGELKAYEPSQLPSGLIRYSSPDGQHDDCVMALALAWEAAVGWDMRGLLDERDEDGDRSLDDNWAKVMSRLGG